MCSCPSVGTREVEDEPRASRAGEASSKSDAAIDKNSPSLPEAFSVVLILGEHCGEFLVRVDTGLYRSALLAQPDCKEPEELLLLLTSQSVCGGFDFSQRTHSRKVPEVLRGVYSQVWEELNAWFCCFSPSILPLRI